LLRRGLRQRERIDRFWLTLPLIGPCVEALALGRLAMALRLTLDSRLPVARAVRLSFAATGNAAYSSRADDVAAALKSGEGMAEALGRAGIFPEDLTL
jgi:type IV pilus assembly protein PilC